VCAARRQCVIAGVLGSIAVVSTQRTAAATWWEISVAGIAVREAVAAGFGGAAE
jgi:hypothetical protein